MGLFTSLPIYWSESHDIAGMLDQDGPRHWARTLIEQRYVVVPLDTLVGGTGQSGVDGLDALLLAQPRALSPEENVALDNWVRRGGHVLVFADPLLTQHSAFALGDKRRPQDVVLLSPVLTHWGLSFTFDEDQPAGVRKVDLLGASVPVEMAGTLRRREGGSCAILGDGIAADCPLGRGRALIVADAALLDEDAPAGESRELALAALMSRAFAE